METREFKFIGEVFQQYKIHYQRTDFFDLKTIPEIVLDPYFLNDLQFALANVGNDDKESFMCEFVIVPFLRDAWKRHTQLYLFSHALLKTQDFNLIPDYLVTAKNETGYKYVNKPLLVTVEAKYEKFTDGWFQASMQMLAAQQMNENPNIPIYAIVTTGDLWQFGRLENKTFLQHPTSVSIENPQHLAGILSFIFGECEKSCSL